MKAPPNLALAFATIERPQVAQRLIRSAREHLKSIPIYVADQSRDCEPMRPFYAAHDARLVRMPYDCGVTTSRNRLAREISEDYFVLCDDDFVIGPETRFDDALTVLAAHPEIGVVGGRLYDFDGRAEYLRNWELYLEYDLAHRVLITVPIDQLAPRARETGGIRFFLCDAVLNFSVMRRSMFENGVSWDERFKSNGEHEDFFLNLKLNTPYRVAYLPTMRAYHHHPEEYRQYRRRLRDRNDGWRRFLEKWGLEQHLELGLGVRSIDDVGALVDPETTRKRFYLNPDLSLQRSESSPGALLVDSGGRIAAVGALDERGEPAHIEPQRPGRLLFQRHTGALSVAPAEPVAPAAEAPSWRRYALEAGGLGRVVGHAEGDFFFRYDAALRSERDLLLWYWRNPPPATAKDPAELAVAVRWTSDTGAVLVWRSRRSLLGCQAAPYWRPLLIELPAPPAEARWLRFDIFTDAGVEQAPLATGFLFAEARRNSAAGPNRPDAPVVDAIALSRLVRDGATPGAPGQTMTEFGRVSPRRAFSFVTSPGLPAMRAIAVDACDGLEALFFVDWRPLGRPLVSARLPPAETGSGRLLALPEAAAPVGPPRLIGFGRKRGLVTLSEAEPRG